MELALKKIQNFTPPLIKTIVIDGKLLNKYMFPDKSVKLDLQKRKEKLFNQIDFNLKNLKELSAKVDNPILKNEIGIAEKRNSFFKETYDVEANKLDENWKISQLPDYDYYSKIFFGTTSKDIEQIDYLPKQNPILKKEIHISKIFSLLSVLSNFFPELFIKIENYPNFKMSVSDGLHMPAKQFYTIQELITLFFHEMSHYIRGFNMRQNLGFVYTFADNYELEEGLALYNEYFYGNQIIDYGEYYPFYHKIYNYLLSDISIEEKRQKTYEILSYKAFSKEKAENFFQRFYRYAPIGGNKLFLKDAIYYNSFKLVKKLLSNSYSMDKLMAIRGGLSTLNYFFSDKKPKNVNYRKYFETMVKEIRKII